MFSTRPRLLNLVVNIQGYFKVNIPYNTEQKKSWTITAFGKNSQKFRFVRHQTRKNTGKNWTFFTSIKDKFIIFNTENNRKTSGQNTLQIIFKSVQVNFSCTRTSLLHKCSFTTFSIEKKCFTRYVKELRVAFHPRFDQNQHRSLSNDYRGHYGPKNADAGIVAKLRSRKSWRKIWAYLAWIFIA